jgi:hypothetical protein
MRTGKLVLAALLAVGVVGLAVGVVGAQGESPLPTPAATPLPTPDPGNGNGNGDGGGVELPEIEFDPTILAVILGLVEFAKQLGVQGKGSLGLSMGLGVALGGSAWLAMEGTPGDFAGWFVVVIVGLAYGLAASGLYDVGKRFVAGK